jgi:sugar fermentation stimulation protein A
MEKAPTRGLFRLAGQLGRGLAAALAEIDSKGALMRFPTALLRGRLVKRYKRFLADVTLDGGEVVTATCPNTGSMLGLAAPGSVVWLSESDSATRKYRHTWEMVEAEMVPPELVAADLAATDRGARDRGTGPTLVGVNTSHPNRIVADAIKAGEVPRLAGYATLRREVKYGTASRIDILLEDPARPPCYVEIKNVHLMREAGLAEFPDSVTERGARHLDELAGMVAAGCRAVMVFLVQRGDAARLALAADIDPAYTAAFERALAAGVEAMALRCRLSPQEIALDGEIAILSRRPAVG